MDNKPHKIFNFDEHYIEKICTHLENEIDNLKVIKNQNLPFNTSVDQHFTAALSETGTITLLELPSLSQSIKNVSNVQIKMMKETTNYVLSDAVQTLRFFQRSQHTQTESISLKDQSNVATVWIIQNEPDNNKSYIKKQEIESSSFKKILSITDRIVTSNIFSRNQIDFLMHHTVNKTMSYRYIFEEILTFSSDKLTNFAVTSFKWNTVNGDILAVGYGKLNNDIELSTFKGVICCWSLKNPVYPERMYEFDSEITCIDFSKANSNILFAGSHVGFIYILDITKEHCVPIIANERYLQNFPIWSIVSFLQTNYTLENEFILSVDGNGSVRKWSTISNTDIIEQMSLIYCGIQKDNDNNTNSSIVQNMSGTVITFHPINENIYFIGTKIGFIVKNTIDSCKHYDSIYMAHNGPVYGIKFSPFCSSIYITYGADWQIKIWIENIELPILSLCYCNVINDADLSPINSTVIVSVSQANICIWDFARKTVEPIVTYTCNTGVHFTLVNFSKCGQNIITGNACGLIQCFHINNMASPSILQVNSILTALENILSDQALIQIIKNIILNEKITN